MCAAHEDYFEKVHDLTIIDIDTLIFYQDSFKTRKVKLDKVIDECHKFINSIVRKSIEMRNTLMSILKEVWFHSQFS